MTGYLTHPNIDPVILQIWGPLAIRWYSLMYIVGFAAVYIFILVQIRKKILRMNEEELSNILFVGMLGVLLGARLGYILFYNLGYYIQNPLQVIKVWEGGMSFHGGLIFTILALFIYLAFKKKSFLDVADVFIVPVPIALMFGRWGNFVNGELWGKPTDAPWGMVFPVKEYSGADNAIMLSPPHFPVSDPAVQKIVSNTGLFVQPGQTVVNLPRHPSPLYEMLLEGAALFIVLFLVSRLKKRPRGILISTFLLGYGMIRFFIEFFREPDAHIGYLAGGWLTMGMLLSLPLIIGGLTGIIVSRAVNRTNELWETAVVTEETPGKMPGGKKNKKKAG